MTEGIIALIGVGFLAVTLLMFTALFFMMIDVFLGRLITKKIKKRFGGDE